MNKYDFSESGRSRPAPIDGFPARLKIAIKGKFTQEALASEIGLSVSGVKKWFSGQVDPSWSGVVLAARACGVSLDWLAGNGSVGSSSDTIDRCLLKDAIHEVLLDAKESSEVLDPEEATRRISHLYRVAERMKDGPGGRND